MRNEEFECKNCNKNNPILPGSCRNHCKYCLYSLHLDKVNPGDRQSDCHGLMKAKSISQNKKKGWMIHHECQKCGKQILNKAANDDDFKKIIALS